MANFNTYIAANKDTIRNVVFEYGTSREYKNQIANLTQINKGSYSYISTQITGLDSAAVYFYRIKANLGKEVIYSAENILKLQRSVVIIPIETEHLSDSSIILHGLVYVNGSYLTNIKFQYGMTKVYGDSIYGSPSYLFNTGTQLVSTMLKQLTPGVYHANISGINGTVRYCSDDFTFTVYLNSLDSLNDGTGVSIFPNPATNNVIIKSLKPVTKVEIYDLFGKLLWLNENSSEINISQWQNGIYFIKIFMGDKLVIKKLIKS